MKYTYKARKEKAFRNVYSLKQKIDLERNRLNNIYFGKIFQNQKKLLDIISEMADKGYTQEECHSMIDEVISVMQPEDA